MKILAHVRASAREWLHRQAVYGQATFGRSTVDAVAAETCVACDGPAVDFSSDAASEGYLRTGICERCQLIIARRVEGRE